MTTENCDKAATIAEQAAHVAPEQAPSKKGASKKKGAKGSKAKAGAPKKEAKTARTRKDTTEARSHKKVPMGYGPLIKMKNHRQMAKIR